MYRIRLYGNNLINKQEFVLLYDFHKSTNPEFPYWNYMHTRQVRIRREIKRRMQGRVSFLQGGHLFHFSFIPCRSLTVFSVG